MPLPRSPVFTKARPTLNTPVDDSAPHGAGSEVSSTPTDVYPGDESSNGGSHLPNSSPNGTVANPVVSDTSNSSSFGAALCTHGSSELEGDVSRKYDQSEQGLCLNKGVNLRRDLEGKREERGHNLPALHTQSGVVVSAIKSLPIDADTVISPTLSRSNSGDGGSSSACKGGPGKKLCGLEVKDGQAGVQCDMCESWFHTHCQTVSKQAYNALKKHDIIAFLCSYCRSNNTSCKACGARGIQSGPGSLLVPVQPLQVGLDVSTQTMNPTSGHNPPSPLGLSGSQTAAKHHEEALANIEKKVDVLAASVTENMVKLDNTFQTHMRLITYSLKEQEGHVVEQSSMIKRALNEGKQEKLLYSEALKKSCDKMVDQVTDKLSAIPTPITNGSAVSGKDAQNIAQVFDRFLDKNKRARNLVVHNLPEQNGGSQAEKSQADIALFTSMIKESLSMNVRATRSFRAGKVVPNKHRLLIVTLEHEEFKHEILKMSTQIKSDQKWKRIFITPDLTYAERQEQRQLREELMSRRTSGETNLIIRRGKIIQTSSRTEADSRSAPGQLCPEVCPPPLQQQLDTGTAPNEHSIRNNMVSQDAQTSVGSAHQTLDTAIGQRHLGETQVKRVHGTDARLPCSTAQPNTPSRPSQN